MTRQKRFEIAVREIRDMTKGTPNEARAEQAIKDLEEAFVLDEVIVEKEPEQMPTTKTFETKKATKTHSLKE